MLLKNQKLAESSLLSEFNGKATIVRKWEIPLAEMIARFLRDKPRIAYSWLIISLRSNTILKDQHQNTIFPVAFFGDTKYR